MKLTTELTRLASEIKKANTRIVRLEDSNTNFSFAYSKIEAQALLNVDNIFTTSASGHTKIRTDLTRLTKEQLKEIKRVVTDFNANKSSQLKNVKKFMKKAEESFAKNHPDEKINFNDLRRAYENEKAEEIKKLYGSDTVVDIASKAQYGDDKFINILIEQIDTSTDEYGKPKHTVQEIKELIKNYPEIEEEKVNTDNKTY